jgi:hypothetical protein
MASSAPPVGFEIMRLPPAIRGLLKWQDEVALGPDRPAITGARSEPRPPARARRRRSDRARLEQFESRLRTLARTGSRSEPLVAGRLQIIALSRIKERLGVAWQRLAASVHRLAEQILDRRLSAEDVYVRAGDRYMILFASLSAVEATFKAQAIAREIAGLLIGELPEVDRAPVRVTVHEIDPGELGGGPSLASLVAAMDDLAGGAAGTCADLWPGAPQFAGRAPAPFDYLPIWSRRGHAVVGYVCTDRPALERDDPDPYERDCRALRAVLASLPEMDRHGHAALVVAPIHWDTLVQLQRRQTYLELCRQVPLPLNRRLGFALLDVAAGAWRDLIRDRLFPLRPFARLFFVAVPPEPTQIRHLAGIGIDALAFEVPADAADDAQHERIRAFAREAARHRIATCALGADDRRTALALLAAGVDFLGGAAVAPRVMAPGAAYRLDLSGGTGSPVSAAPGPER